ncbi:MAG: SET domain-containing protein [Candidatus Paceibacterota bacterium]
MKNKNIPKVLVKRSKSGLGLFAVEPIKKGQFIIEYVGEKVTTDEANRRGGLYLFELNSRWTMDGKSRKNVARYINHSCCANAESEIKGGKILISAIKNIKEGEEITYDYGKEFFEEYIKPKGCRCTKHL